MSTDLLKVKELFLAVLELPAQERATYLDTACSGDTSLRQQIEAMLQSHQNSGELLPAPAEMLAATEIGAGSASARPADASSATLNEHAPGAADDLSFLTPSMRTGHLGRLGHYEVKEVIGKGGFGVVLKAFDEKLHRVVAIKVLSPAYAANGSARARFIREARTAAAVKNEHVVAIYSVQDEAQPPYLVMELIDGISLQDKLDKKGPLSVREILRIGTQIAEGLVAAHKQGLVHRDIKPANILLENGVERVKITDFGLARAVDDASVSQSGTVAGTPTYMSPEQAEGLPIDHRSDLFSLGTVLYTMCTGHSPFRASGTHAVLKRVIDASPRPICEINNEIPDWLEMIIARLHAKKPEHRFQTAKEVAEVLGQRLSDVQAGRAMERASHVSGGSAAATSAATPPPADAGGSRADAGGSRADAGGSRADAGGSRADAGGSPNALLAARRLWITALALALMGAVFTYTAAMVFTLPAGQISPPGVQWLVAAVGLGLLATAGFLGFKARRRRASPMDASDSPTRRFGKRAFLNAVVVLAAIVVGIFCWYASTLDRYVRNVGIIILDDDAKHVHLQIKKGPWLATVAPGRAAEIEPGVYEIEAIAAEGYKVTAIGQHRRSHPFMASGLNMPGPSCKLTLARGEEVRVKIKTAAAPSLPGSKSEPDWVQLFSGKDLDGWKIHSAQPGTWKVENGLLVGRDGPSYLYSLRDDYRDFHFRVKAKINARGNSGMHFRVSFPNVAKKNYEPSGYEAQIAGPLGSGLCTGSLFRPPGARLFQQDEPLVKEDTWFTQEVIARGKRIIVRLDGKTMVDLTDEIGPLAGRLALESQQHTIVHFEKVEIKELPPSTSEWIAFFNGKDLTGWKPHRLNSQPWTVEDGVLVCRGRGNSYLFTDKGDFGAFHLRAEVKLNATGDGAINFGSPFRLIQSGGAETLIPVDGYLVKLGYSHTTGSLQWMGPMNKSLSGAPPKMHEPDKWFDMDVIVKNKHVQILVNGKVATDYHDPAFSPRRGHIMLQSSAPKAEPPAEVRFRKIEIKELPPQTP